MLLWEKTPSRKSYVIIYMNSEYIISKEQIRAINEKYI